MTTLLILNSNSVSNPLTLDLSAYVDVTPGNGLDPADPAFTQRVWSRSLLKQGATLALEQLVEREMQFPLKLGPVGGAAGAPQTLSATLGLIQQINQILESPGATMTWQAPGTSQPTYFDVLSGLVESAYNYRAEQQFWEIVNLRVFTQPLGRTGAPRPYATASGVGPLLMISPYASGGQFAAVLPYASQVLNDNPVSYWRLDETSGSLASDQLGINGGSYVGTHTLNQTGALTNSGDNDASVFFTASSGWAEIPYDPSLNTPQFTLECWANMASSGLNALMQTWTAPAGYLLREENSSGAVGFYTHVANGSFTALLTAGGQLPAGAWTHLAATFDGQFRKIYVNGVQKAADTNPVPGYFPNTSVALGLMGAFEFGNGGNLDEAAYYPYALSGQQIAAHYAAGASSHPAGLANQYSGYPTGPSSGIAYYGNPSLAGDAPAQLQISYVGPLPNTATNTGVTPTVAVSLLPDANYRPLVSPREIKIGPADGGTVVLQTSNTVIGSTYLSYIVSGAQANYQTPISFAPIPAASAALGPPVAWAGQHRLFAIARASSAGSLFPMGLMMLPGPNTPPTGASVPVPVSTTASSYDWGVYDLGSFSVRASEYPTSIQVMMLNGGGAAGVLDIAGLVQLPDANTWFMNPANIGASIYGYPAGLAASGAPLGYWSNTLLLDDVVGDQFIYGGQSQTFAPSPIGSVPSSARITPYSRGLLPTPDPLGGLPIIAILGVGQTFDPPMLWPRAVNNVNASPSHQANPQNLRALAQVNVLERTRYLLP